MRHAQMAGVPRQLEKRRRSWGVLHWVGMLVPIRLILLVATVACLVAGARAQTPEEDSVKAIFLTRFPSFVSWPQEQQADMALSATLCFVGSPSLAGKVRAIVQANGPQRLRVVELQKIDPSVSCQVLFAGIGAEQTVAEALSAVRGRSILTVTDERNGESRGIIHFTVIDRRVRFYIDLEEAQENRLQLNARLLGVAASVRQSGVRP